MILFYVLFSNYSINLKNIVHLEELDQEIASNHATLLPLLFDLMNDPNTEIPKQACNALDAILEGLDDEILQYLPTLMERLLLLLDNGPNEVKTTVTAAIGSAAHAAGSVSFFILYNILSII